VAALAVSILLRKTKQKMLSLGILLQNQHRLRPFRGCFGCIHIAAQNITKNV
jgi:hypothetical protein